MFPSHHLWIPHFAGWAKFRVKQKKIITDSQQAYTEVLHFNCREVRERDLWSDTKSTSHLSKEQ